MAPLFRNLFLTCLGILLSTIIWGVLVSSVAAQSINLALDLYYSDPTDTNSAGVWELVALASDRGLAGASVRLENVMPSAMFMAPSGSATELPVVGFRETFGGGAVSFATDQGDHLQLIYVQPQTSAPGPQGLFYDVGVPGGATQPGENGTPAIAGLAGVNLPWNYDDLIGDFADDGIKNGSGAFQDGTLLALGMFGPNTAPAFYSGQASGGNVFTALGTAADPPPIQSIVAATINTTVRDNTGILAGDANFDGTVDGQDFLIWNNTKFTATAGWRNGDFNGDKFVDGGDFLIWNGNKFMSVDGIAAVPEPTGVALLLLSGLGWMTFSRRSSCVRRGLLAVALIATSVVALPAYAAEQSVGVDIADTMIAFDSNSTNEFNGSNGVPGNAEDTAWGGETWMTIRGGDPFNSLSLTAKPLVRFELQSAIEPWRPYFLEVTTNSAGNSNDTFRVYSIQDPAVQNFNEATITWNNAPAAASDSFNNFNAAGPEAGIFFAPSPGQSGFQPRIPLMGSQLAEFVDLNTNDSAITLGFTSTDTNRMELRTREQSGGVDKPRIFTYDVLDSQASGSATDAGTFAGGAPSAGNLYRVTSGHQVDVTATGFAGEGVIVDDGTLDIASGVVDIPLIVLNSGGDITKSFAGNVQIGAATTDRYAGSLYLNRNWSYTAAAGEDLTINSALRGEANFTFNGGAGSNLTLQFPQGLRGELFFEGAGDEIHVSQDEGIGGRWNMNSTGANRIAFSGLDTEQEFGVGTAIFNQPGEIEHRGSGDRLHGLAFLEANADLNVNLTAAGPGDERLLRITRSLRGSASATITVNGTPFNPVSGGVTVNELEIGTVQGSDTNVENGSFAGTVQTNDYASIAARIGLPAAKLIANANGVVATGHITSANDEAAYGALEIKAGGQLVVGGREDNSILAGQDHRVQDVRVTVAEGRSGDITLADGSKTTIQVNGMTARTDTVDGEFDRIFVEGAASIDGTLEILFNATNTAGLVWTTPSAGDKLDIIIASSTPGSPADFNEDGIVDELDYDIWDAAVGSSAAGDADDDGDTDGDDFLVWQRDFGLTSAEGTITGMFDNVVIQDLTNGGLNPILAPNNLTFDVNYLPGIVQLEVISAALVPEPTAWVLVLVGLAFWRLNRR